MDVCLLMAEVVFIFTHIDEAPAAKKKEDVHVPAKNIGDIKSAEKVNLAVYYSCTYILWFFRLVK